MSPAADFTVHHSGLDATAGRLDRAATDLDSVKARLQYPPDYSADYYGEYGAADAARNFITSWQDEMQLDSDALRELAGKLRQSASNYRAADESIAASFRR